MSSEAWVISSLVAQYHEIIALKFKLELISKQIEAWANSESEGLDADAFKAMGVIETIDWILKNN